VPYSFPDTCTCQKRAIQIPINLYRKLSRHPIKTHTSSLEHEFKKNCNHLSSQNISLNRKPTASQCLLLILFWVANVNRYAIIHTTYMIVKAYAHHSWGTSLDLGHHNDMVLSVFFGALGTHCSLRLHFVGRKQSKYRKYRPYREPLTHVIRYSITYWVVLGEKMPSPT
jgi:hypothetical protein